jgi:hypothetical protein
VSAEDLIMWKPLYLLPALVAVALPLQAETRRVEGLEFGPVLVYGDVEVKISQGDKTELLIRGDEKDLEKQPFLLEDGSLVLGFSRDHRHMDFDGVKFLLTTPTLEHLEVKGSGDVYVTPWDTGDLFVSVTGSGRVRLFEVRGEDLTLQMSGSGAIQAADLTGRSLTVVLSGSGDIQLGRVTAEETELTVRGSGDITMAESSSTSDLELSIVGSGDVDVGKLDTHRAEVNIVGSGDARIGGVAVLEVNILGSGDVGFRGDPEIEQTVLGSGDLRRER